MIKNIRNSVILLFFCSMFYAQQGSKEIGFISDNDLYTSSKNDMYYTNGLELFYRYATKVDNKSVDKNIYEFRLGQYIYNPRFINKEAVTINNRPFAGYLFVNGAKNIFYKSQSVLKLRAEIGFLGPNGLGREMQEHFHTIIGYKEVFGWDNQIHNAFGLQLHALYSKKIFARSTNRSIDLHWQSEADAGTIWNGVSTGFMSRIAFKKLLPLNESNMHEASAGTLSVSIPREFYFYILPSLNVQMYDATIQGSLFNDSSPITFDIIPLRFNAEFGLKYRHDKLNLSYSFIYHGKELISRDMTGSFYGSIRLGYLLK